MAAKKSVPDVTYMLQMRDDTKKKVTVPGHWKVTFGPLVPGSKEGGLNSSGAVSLRFYDGPIQKAVFTGVESFRDMSIKIEEERVKVQAETYFKEDENGERKNVVMEGRIREWVNPDAPGVAEAPRPRLPDPGAAARAAHSKDVLEVTGAVTERSR